MKIQEGIIIPGPRKCGSTSIFQILDKNKKIDSPLIKEPQFFLLDKKTINENIDWYVNLYSYNELPKLDASALYFTSDRALNNISSIFNNVKILIILRDPVKRAYSAYFHMKKKVPSKEKRPFNYITEEISGPDFKDIISSENENLKKAVRKDLVDKNYLNIDYHKINQRATFDSNFEDPLMVYKYFQNSLYSKRIKKFEKLFDDIKIMYLEKIIRNPKTEIKKIFDFLGIPALQSDLELPHSNPTGVPNNIFTRKIEKIRTNNKIFRDIIYSSPIINRLFRKVHSNLVKSFFSPKPKLNKSDYLKAKDVLEHEYDYWYTKKSELKELWDYD